MQIKILNITTQHEVCGIAKYQEQYMAALNVTQRLKSDLFPHSPNQMKSMNSLQFDMILHELEGQLKNYDILHLQHEFAFYFGTQLKQLIAVAKRLSKPIIVTIHTSPDIVRPASVKPRGIRSSLLYLRSVKKQQHFYQSFTSAIRQAELILVHNSRTLEVMRELDIPAEKLQLIELPVPLIDTDPSSNRLHQALSVKDGDVLFGVIGFVARVKGVDQAVRALSFLPKNYKLAIIGGIHPESGASGYIDEVCDLVVRLRLEDRVHITGFVPEVEELNALIRECDICVYPYERGYYAGVSSAALADAFANHKPVIAYPTAAFREMNEQAKAMVLCKSFNYYELARELQAIDSKTGTEASMRYAAEHSYAKVAPRLIDIYASMLPGVRDETNADA